MKFNEMAYPEIFIISENEYSGRRDMSTNELKIPYTIEPDLKIGDTIFQISGKNKVYFKVIDLLLKKNGTLKRGTKHPNLLILKVENKTLESHTSNSKNSTYNIFSISGEQIHIGDQNIKVKNISLHQLIEHVAKSDDPEAKSTLKDLLQNSTVGSLIGAGASSLINLL